MRLSMEETYKKHQMTAKIVSVLSPIVYWGSLALAITCFILAIRSSIGNMVELIDLLDNATHTGEELAVNYANLVERYGEWVIGTGSNGFTVVFINIKKVLFSGFAVTNAILSVVFLLTAYLLGKWGLPLISKSITQSNQDMVNLRVINKLK